MAIIIDGKNMPMGRLASYAAKIALKGNEVVILNCNEVIITGKKKTIKKEFSISSNRIGHSQKGPKIIKNPERIVKRTIRGMLPDHREGRGRVAYKKIICYNKIPKEFEKAESISFENKKTNKFISVRELIK